ncbi:SRPBCC family protein [Nakamurella sp. A5-74]|uniref:SRPBCC family protein n=1 Tax=Nakamurella sp. A5-74 TaxID=3158264 RepID=A0AAU8DNZ9_9ACTN
MATTHRDMPCGSGAVSEVLADGWLFGLWVVGSSRIRDVDAGWPAEGAKIHHSFGVWPLLIDDVTECLGWQPDQRIELLARGWPAGEASVVLTIEDRAAGCRVTIVEDAVKGPGTLVPRPLRSAMLHWRNVESLRRLEYLAVGQAARPTVHHRSSHSLDEGPAEREEKS